MSLTGTRNRCLLLMTLCAALALSGQAARAEDVLIRHRSSAGVKQEADYSDAVIRAALERTRKKYGGYRVEQVSANLARDRLLLELKSGETVNAAVAASQATWEAELLPVLIPLDMGLSSYRIALTSRSAQPRIAEARTLEALKALRLGVGAGWSSRKVMEANGFKTVTAEGFEPLIKMLMADRIDYFPRGINEVFVEFDNRDDSNPELQVEREIVMAYPLPSFIFVSPKAPRLQQRLAEGLEAMVRDGSLRKLMLNYHADMIRRASFCSRRVYRFENPMVTDTAVVRRKELWFDPYDPKTGICQQSARIQHRK